MKTPIIKAVTTTDTNGQSLYSLKGEALDNNENRVRVSLLTDNEGEYLRELAFIKENYEVQIVRIFSKSTDYMEA